MSHPLEVSVGSKLAFSAPPPHKSTQKNQDEDKNTAEPTPLQQRKRDAFDLAELIYDIYNSNCPVIELNRNQGGKNDV